MAIVFDPAKNRRNIEKHNLSFEQVEDFDFENGIFEIDNRNDYGEIRVNALGFLKGRLHALVFTERGEDMRVISFRRANRSEAARYEKAKS